MAETGGVDGIGGGERLGPLGAHVLGRGVVDRGRCVVADARVAVVVVVVVEEGLAKALASSSEPKRSGKAGQYLRVRNCASL